MRLEQARAILEAVLGNPPGLLSVFVADAHGELVAAATMDGAEPDTRLNAQRKAYTAARGTFRSTGELAAALGSDPVELARWRVIGPKPDADRAKHLYERASLRGRNPAFPQIAGMP